MSNKLTEYPKGIKFKYSWRKYQQRVLDDLQLHLTDGHLHIVAPPGSGKTVLGLEVALRLNHPTLILAPTIAIRNQWIQRFCELFLQTTQPPHWISRDIRKPQFMTVVTYQGLHAACSNVSSEGSQTEEEEETDEPEYLPTANVNFEGIVAGLRAQHVKTIVVDEAHHLKNEWWGTLTRLKNRLDPVIVGLTATPPYDVTPTEWQRYIDLNGPVDAEISVPELVIEGDLCPHQDYVYFTVPTEVESQHILDFRENVSELFQELRRDETIVAAIERHPIWQDPMEQLDWIYSNLSCYSACLIFLRDRGKQVSKAHLRLIGDGKLEIPELDYEWMDVLLEFYLYKDESHFREFSEHRKALEEKLRRRGVIERRQISLSHCRSVTRLLTSSVSKLNAIEKIVDFEYGQLGANLRLVILSDFIRKEFYNGESNGEPGKIGVMPIFEKLRRGNTNGKKIGVLTGSMIIIPAASYEAFTKKVAQYGITQVNAGAVPFDSNYMLIHQSEQIRHDIVHIVTEIFQRGEIEVLIGTKALLGEGWDAPAINALILASFVGSFVLSNQMRGRAIRTQSGNEGKTGNIWHLACVDPTSTTGGDDFDLMARRFRSFVGVSFKEAPSIENGIGRLNIPRDFYRRDVITKKNAEMLSLAGDRESLKQRWKDALATGVNLVEEIVIPFAESREYKPLKSMYLTKTIGNLIAMLAFGWLGYSYDVLEGLGRSAGNMKTLRDLYVFLLVAAAGGVLIFGRQTYKTLRLYFKYRDISKDIKKMGDSLLNALIIAKIIRTEDSKLSVEAAVDSFGAVYCHLEGGTAFERSTFINALQEIVAPIDNPRYVIVRKNTFMRFVKQKDYHSVPEVLGKNKDQAEHFKDQWKRFVGSCELIFTRSIEGRKLLLESRLKSLAAQLHEVEHVNRWR